jgi:hypothetical protein
MDVNVPGAGGDRAADDIGYRCLERIADVTHLRSESKPSGASTDFFCPPPRCSDSVSHRIELPANDGNPGRHSDNLAVQRVLFGTRDLLRRTGLCTSPMFALSSSICSIVNTANPAIRYLPMLILAHMHGSTEVG